LWIDGDRHAFPTVRRPDGGPEPSLPGPEWPLSSGQVPFRASTTPSGRSPQIRPAKSGLNRDPGRGAQVP
jgi:hypothetical protein